MRRDPATGAPDLFAVARDWLHAYLPTVRGLSGGEPWINRSRTYGGLQEEDHGRGGEGGRRED